MKVSFIIIIQFSRVILSYYLLVKFLAPPNTAGVFAISNLIPSQNRVPSVICIFRYTRMLLQAHFCIIGENIARCGLLKVGLQKLLIVSLISSCF